MKTKLGLLFSILVIASIALSACGGAATATEAPVVETEAPVVATEAPVVATEAPAGSLRIWADETRAPILQALAADFLAQ